MPNFDDLPKFRQPNPLPCGCGIVGIPGLNLAGTKTEHRQLSIAFCPLHASAPAMLTILKRYLDGSDVCGVVAALDDDVRAVIAKATKKSVDAPPKNG